MLDLKGLTTAAKKIWLKQRISELEKSITRESSIKRKIELIELIEELDRLER